MESMNFSNLQIETPRLILLPLRYGQLRKFLNNNLALEKELGLQPQPRVLSEKLEEILEEEILVKVNSHPEKYYFYTLWIIIRKADLTIVGDINSKDEPTLSGEIEIGYETIDEFQNLGYMTEAVNGFIEWLSTRHEVRKLITITLSDNLPSIAVMKKNQFKPYLIAGNTLRWEKIIRNNAQTIPDNT